MQNLPFTRAKIIKEVTMTDNSSVVMLDLRELSPCVYPAFGCYRRIGDEYLYVCGGNDKESILEEFTEFVRQHEPCRQKRAT